MIDNYPPLCGSYDSGDVTFLMTPITLEPIDVGEKERRIQSGAFHYSEMLSPESAPNADYMDAYQEALAENGRTLAGHINVLADNIVRKGWAFGTKERPTAIISLARAGTPIGILITRALRRRGAAVKHYSVSIIRGRGIDLNALCHIMKFHDATVFVDGWTGKGAIARELRGPTGPIALGIEPHLVVVADPAGVADLAATGEDFVIPSGILNGIVSGLVSRSVLNDQIEPHAFHGCVILDHLKAHDVSRAFVEIIDSHAIANAAKLSNASDEGVTEQLRADLNRDCKSILALVQGRYGVADANRIKPGIAEATRAVLRRVPERLLVCNQDDPAVRHLMLLAHQKAVNVERLPGLSSYRAIAIIAEMGDG
jgi:hypothetical protein